MPPSRVRDEKLTSTVIEITVNIVNQLKKSNLNFKDFLYAYLVAEDSDGTLKASRRFWGRRKGWASTLSVLEAMRKHICNNMKGRLLWKSFILSEKRADQLRSAMGFLWSLIRHRLSSNRPGTEPDSEVMSEASEISVADSLVDLGSGAEPVDITIENTHVPDASEDMWVDIEAGSTNLNRVMDDDSDTLSGGFSEDDLFTVQRDGGTGMMEDGIRKGRQAESHAEDETFEVDDPLEDLIDGEDVTYVKKGSKMDQAKRRFDCAMRDAEEKEVDVKDFLPSLPERAHWKDTIDAQLGQAYLDYIVTENRTLEPAKLPNLTRTPPSLDPLPAEKPDVVMLPLMDLSCGSAEGVGQVLDHVANITGRPLKDNAHDLQVVEGDVGTCINLESYRAKLHPAGRRYESMINYLTLPGAAHSMWNVGQWQILGGWGTKEDTKDLPYSKSWEVLSGKTEKPVVKKDFGVIMRMIYHIHFATMVWCLRDVIRSQSKTPDLSDTNTAKSIIDQTRGSGTKVRRLAVRYALNIKLLIMTQIKNKAGFESVFQTKHIHLTTKSIQAFLRVADRMYSSHNDTSQPEPMPDLLQTGFEKLQEIFQTEYTHHAKSRFHWGSTQSHDIPTFAQDQTATTNQPGEESLEETSNEMFEESE
ncbi:uncharacterized protein MELLADRAFT_70048 [Melampsora larici-populina 98AG31]|uniref:DUF6589 domain-containing protein n=1 Tax=Melampsora larici-populina (strain 98AG31 / pathotype 3-4-7) TaxID=747676 RepID=F4SDB6_MELLP|nr:uncharacterized protein MELLADRAFT_70048 [Melampsora larici-populina 98AG31]EGF97362.1 hypothetical protein MELLADRAFT_70048 [Melampsora larici-populina 98AG31]